MFPIDSGIGDFVSNSVNKATDARPDFFNLSNSPEANAVLTPDAENGGTIWVAICYHITDPDAWAIHSHIHNHVEVGVLALIQDSIYHWPAVP